MKIVAADPGDAHAMELIRALDDDTRQRYPGEPVFGVEQPEALGLYRSVGFAATPLFDPYVGSRFSVCFAKPLPTHEDVEFLRCFEACTLPDPEWIHLAHVHMAWLYLSQLDSTAALKRIREGIKRFNTEVLDRRQEYHETVTVAFARIISDRMRADEAWDSFAARIDDIVDSDTPMLDSYYSSGLLSSVAARDRFVDPDLRDLPEFRDAPEADEVEDG